MSFSNIASFFLMALRIGNSADAGRFVVLCSRFGVVFGGSRNRHSPGLLSIYMPDHRILVAVSQ